MRFPGGGSAGERESNLPHLGRGKFKTAFFLLVVGVTPGANVGTAYSVRSSPQVGCIAQVTPDASSRLPYSLRRDGRCEGYYLRRLSSGTALHVLSLTSTRRRFNPREIASTPLAWQAPDDAVVTITASSLLPNTRYLMSFQADAGVTAYRWPLNTLANTPLRGQDLGFLAWGTKLIGGRREKVFLPLSIDGSRGGVLPRRYRLEILPERQIKDVELTVTRFIDDTLSETPVYSTRVEAGPYVARVPFPVDLPELGPSGVYHLQVSATSDAGGTAVDMWLYHHMR